MKRGAAKDRDVSLPASDIEEAERRLRRHAAWWKTALALVIVPVLALLAPLAVVAAFNLTATPGKVERIIPSWWYFSGSAIPVELRSGPAGQAQPKPTDAVVMIALDHSGSMGAPHRPGDPLHDSLAATGQLTNALLGAGAEVGFVQFDHNVERLAPIGRDGRALTDARTNVRAGGGTDIAKALRFAVADLLAAGKARPSAKKFLVLISDGQDSVDNVRPILGEIEKEGITLVGIGLGPTASNSFYTQALGTDCNISPTAAKPESRPNTCRHRFHCCDSSQTGLIEFMLKMAMDEKLVGIRGLEGRLVEYPRAQAFPLRDETIPRSADGGIEFPLFYVFDSPTSQEYTLTADRWGIHPIADAPAVLSFAPTNGDINREIEKSGDSPWVYVLPWWLPLLLLGPALLFAALGLFPSRDERLGDPRLIPPLGGLSPVPGAPVRRFRRRSMVPIEHEGEGGLIPTVVIAIGPRGGQMLAATAANRREAGLPPESAWFKPLYIDCRELAPAEFPVELGGEVNPSWWRRLPVASDLTALIEDIAAHPAAHPAVLPWLRADRLVGTVRSVAAGCGGDRTLARVAIYQDLLSEHPKMHELCDEVVSWASQYRQSQILVLAAAEEDQGSGMLVDLAYQLRRRLNGRAIPLTLILDTTRDIAFSRAGNGAALLSELEVLQAGAGLPYLGMDRLNNSVRFDSTTTQELPLFDRMILPRRLDEPAPPATAGSLVLALTDAGIAGTLRENLAGTAWRSRDAKELARPGVFTEIDPATLVLPIAVWQERWSLWALRDLLQSWIGYEIAGGKARPPQDARRPPDEVWAAANNMCRFLSLPGMDVWRAFGGGDALPATIPEQPALVRSLTTIVACGLNAAPSIHQPASPAALLSSRQHVLHELCDMLHAWMARASGLPPAVSEALEIVRAELEEWRATLIGDELHAIAERLAALDAYDLGLATQARTGMRATLPPASWKRDLTNDYRTQLLPKATTDGDLAARLWWTTAADGGSLDLLAIGLGQVRLTRDDVTAGKLREWMREVLTRVMMPEIGAWSLEDFLTQSDFGKLAGKLGLNDSNHTYFFHALQDAGNIEAFHRGSTNFASAAMTAWHSLGDRITFLSVKEEVQSNLVAEENRKGEEMYIQPVQVLTRDIAKAGASLARYGVFPSKRRLLAQEIERLDFAVMAAAGGMITVSEDVPGCRRLVYQTQTGHSHPLTPIGSVDHFDALARLTLWQRDCDGQPIELDGVRSRWRALTTNQRQEVLDRLCQDTRPATDDWMSLLAWAATSRRSELER